MHAVTSSLGYTHLTSAVVHSLATMDPRVPSRNAAHHEGRHNVYRHGCPGRVPQYWDLIVAQTSLSYLCKRVAGSSAFAESADMYALPASPSTTSGPGSRDLQTQSSVKEFLISEQFLISETPFSQFRVLEPAHTTSAQMCLGVLFQFGDHSDAASIRNSPLVPYSAQSWFYHAWYGGVALRIQGAMYRMFD
ncbi:hypothetical protein BC834DRAFT_75568 [Gloeopeniophorella convolvens]|nr:hypothetical protein BC834DRAFT_75568 [Gloeopeniophorella convolvens]